MRQFEDLKISNKIIKNLFIFLSSIFIFSCCGTFCKRQEYAENLILKIEAFKIKEKRFPVDVSELGLSESENSPAFYQKMDETSFEVWYAVGFESKIYNSKTKKWREEG